VVDETTVDVEGAPQDEAQEIGIRDLLDAGLHFGHQTKRWNPKMKPYIFDKRNGIHIIDLAKSLIMLKAAAQFVYDVAASGDSILFVGTKKQAQKSMTDTAVDAGQPFVTHRWLGGMLTNVDTIRNRVKRLKQLEKMEKDDVFATMHKKEASRDRHELAKLQRNLGGIADMKKLPGAMFIIDINREDIAIKEANRLNIPVIAMVDTNCDPDLIDYPIPSNDDAIRAIKLVAGEISAAMKKGQAEYARVAAEENRKREEEAKKVAEARAKAAKATEAARAEKAKADAVKAKEAAETKKAAKAEAAAAKAETAKAEAKKEEAAPTTEAVKADAPKKAAAPKAEAVKADAPKKAAAPKAKAAKADAPKKAAAPKAKKAAKTEKAPKSEKPSKVVEAKAETETPAASE